MYKKHRQSFFLDLLIKRIIVGMKEQENEKEISIFLLVMVGGFVVDGYIFFSHSLIVS